MIRSNYQWREFVYRTDVPADVLESEFDWMKRDGQWPEEDYLDGFFQYRGCWYHLSNFDFLRHTDGTEMQGWNGYAGDSFFSGVLIKLSDDGEQFQVGTYTHTSTDTETK